MKRTLVGRDFGQDETENRLEIRDYYRIAVSSALKELLEKRHLYQSVRVDNETLTRELAEADVKNGIMGLISQYHTRGNPDQIDSYAQSIRERFLKYSIDFSSGAWTFYLRGNDLPKDPYEAMGLLERTFILPPIAIACAKCDAVLPAHNPGYVDCGGVPSAVNTTVNGVLAQIFSFPYQCQRCLGEPIVFLVHRCGFKLTLVGRSHLEMPLIPPYLPRTLRRYYGDAVISANCKKNLAAIIYLRTMIEQHMRLTAKVTRKASGDELADEYVKTLPESFAHQIPSLKKCYENLSIAIHTADENPEIFVRELAQIDAHFKAVDTFQQLMRIHR